MKNRIFIYFFYDADGIVDNYVFYFLNELKKVVSTSVVVVNGCLNREGRNRLEESVDMVICRENIGFDSWAYKEAIEAIGWERLLNYDELVMANFTMFGPFYPFEDAFERMEASEADFWGLQRSYENRNIKTVGGRKTVHGYMPEFPLSSFWVIREKLLHSYEFKHYWDTLHEIKDYTDACIYHEPVFAKSMCDYGYTMDTLVTDKEKGYCNNPTIDNVYMQVVKEGVPIIRRRAFFNLFEPIHDEGVQTTLYDTLQYVKKSTNYNIDLIYENLLRTCNLADLYQRMVHNYIIPSYTEAVIETSKNDIAAGFMINSEEDFNAVLPYLGELYKVARTILFTTCQSLGERSADSIISKVEIVNISEHISCPSLFMLNYLKQLQQFRIVFIANALVSTQGENNRIVNDIYVKRYLDSTIGSKEIIKNNIYLLEDNERLGILTALQPFHSVYFKNLGNDWNGKYSKVKEIADKCHLKVDIRNDKSPMKIGAAFWCRMEAMESIEQFSDVLQEVSAKEQQEIFDNLLSYICQDNGYYPAYELNEKQATVDLFTKTIMLENINKSILNGYGYTTHFRRTLKLIQNPKTIIKKESQPAKEIIKKCYVQKEVDPEVFMEDVETKLLFKKLIKRIIPKIIWNKLRWKKYEKTLQKIKQNEILHQEGE